MKTLTKAKLGTAAMAALMITGCATGNKKPMMHKNKDMTQCHGINACKGKSACATANSACKGLNSCKGKGWLTKSVHDCMASGGTPSN